MAVAKSGIEWTDATWNVVTGCSKVSPGCAHCYAEVVAGRFWPTQYPTIRVQPGEDGEGTCGPDYSQRPRRFTDVQCHGDRLDQPLRWKRGRRIFVNSMSDLFHEDVPDAFIDRVFAVMALAPQHTFQVLTKRAERMREYMTAPIGYSLVRGGRVWTLANDLRTDPRFSGGSLKNNRGGRTWPLPNVWLGVSVENQRFADERIPLLLQTRAAIRFISAEPLLGSIRLDHVPIPTTKGDDFRSAASLDWVIVGGESGPGARPFDVSWARSIAAQCQAAGVPVFVKQLGGHAINGQLTAKELVEGAAGRPRPTDQPLTEADAAAMLSDLGVVVMNRRLPLRDRKGGAMEEWPEDLRVREFPRAAVPA
jgi:protein gp37